MLNRLARRAALLVVGFAVLWSLLVAGVIASAIAAQAVLAPHAGRAGAWAIVGGTAIALAAAGLWLGARKRRASVGADLPALVEAGRAFVAAHPFESVLGAVAAGVLASQTSSADLARLWAAVRR